MKKMATKVKTSITFLIIFVPWVGALCPEGATIKPCECRYENETISLFCESIELSPLTAMLRNKFCGFTIDKFYLRAPSIDHLPSNLFIKNIVHEFQIENANISHFTQAGRSAFFSQEPHLKFLSMRRCSLGEELSWEMIAELRALTYLDLSFNKLKRIPKQWFYHPPPSLRSLILKENRITELESGAFRYMHKLNELDLSSNNIEEIKRDIFPYPGNELIFLRLSDNNLDSLPEDLFDEMLGLRRLYLDNNKLATLSEAVWKPIWTELERVELYGNPIECSCDLQWMWDLKPPQQLYGNCNICEDVEMSYLPGCNRTEAKELRKLVMDDFDLWNC